MGYGCGWKHFPSTAERQTAMVGNLAFELGVVFFAFTYCFQDRLEVQANVNASID